LHKLHTTDRAEERIVTERPLTGTRVLEIVDGAMAHVGRYLAELGAEVIRLERRGTSDQWDLEGTSPAGLDLLLAIRGKRRFTLDPNDQRDVCEFDRLIGEADILLHDLPELSPLSSRLDAAALAARHPALVVLAISDFGRDSAIAGWKGSEAVFHALSGELARSGIPGREPMLPPGRLAQACAANQAATAVLAAYWHRLRCGVGDLLDFSILDGAMQALDPGFGIAGSAAAGAPASQLPRGRPEARFQYPIFPCKDGFVRICVLAPRQWQAMFAWLGEPEEFSDPSFNNIVVRFKSRELPRAIAVLFAGQTRDELEAEGERRGVPVASVYRFEETLAHPQLLARGALAQVGTKDGRELTVPNGTMVIDGERLAIAEATPETLQPVSEAAFRTAPPSLPAPTVPPKSRPLERLRVLDLGVIVVGAESGRLLGDLGADVVKVENPAFPDGSRQTRDGGPMSASFAAGNRNKRSVGLDLRSEEGKAILADLLGEADVLLSNFKPGTLEALGFGEARLHEINPGLIMCDSSAWGPTGPWSGRMGYGPLVRAGTGLTDLWRYPDAADGFADAITVYPDHAAARTGVIGTLALLIRRLRSGCGGRVSISQAECILDHFGGEIAAISLGAAQNSLAGSEVAVLACAGDDEWCVVSIENDAQLENLCAVIGAPPDANVDQIRAAAAEWASRLLPLAAAEQLQAAGIAAAPMLRVCELPDHPHYRSRDVFRESEHMQLGFKFPLECDLIRSMLWPGTPQRQAPVMGEHCSDVLAEWIGLDPAECDRLLDAGTLYRREIEPKSA
jgi:crotonobetainyl-CoA:carnitine CoA-transferase CaiB-like acyl-CoA transferase